MKKYIKPATTIIKLSVQHHLLEGSTTISSAIGSDSQNNGDALSRGGTSSLWDDEE